MSTIRYLWIVRAGSRRASRTGRWAATGCTTGCAPSWTAAAWTPARARTWAPRAAALAGAAAVKQNACLWSTGLAGNHLEARRKGDGARFAGSRGAPHIICRSEVNVLDVVQTSGSAKNHESKANDSNNCTPITLT